MAAERAKNPEQARSLILEQIAFINDFVAEHSADYAVAYTPQEAREILNSTDKIVIVHAIEGGRKILQSPEDAAFWKSQGVTLITLIHLLDDELGGSAINPDWVGPLINPVGDFRRLFAPKKRGLTAHGKKVVVELAEAGILMDLSHMSPESVQDALEICRKYQIPPVVTHGMFEPITASQRSFSEADLLEIYRLGGIFSLPLHGRNLNPRHPGIPIPDDLKPSTRDMFRFHTETLSQFLQKHAAEILGRLPEAADLPRLALGWASDWNGWTQHTRPDPRKEGLELDELGLAHPGLLPQYWQRLQEDGLDLAPFEYAAERFLQLWERMDRWEKPI
jgi:microsomal dipeptidase-like Zn-dependent dipeptidase